MLLALMKKELLALSRDLHGLAALFLMPTLFIIIMSLALKEVYNPPVKSISYVVEDRDGTELSHALLSQWEERHGKPQEQSNDWHQQVRSGSLGYALIIEPGFTMALFEQNLEEQGIQLRLLTDPGMESGAFAATRAELLMVASGLRGRALFSAAPATQQVSGDATRDLSAEKLIEAERLSAGTRPTSVQQNVPAWLVFGMFFVVASIAGLFVEERQCGALARLATLGVSTRMIILSKALPYLGINAIQSVLMLAVGVWLIPLLGGEALSLAGVHWGALLLVLLAVSLAAIGMALTLASVVRTHAQAAAVGPIINVVMAAIGGVMVPKFVMPDFMQRVAELSPMNWGLEGVLAVLLRGGGPAEVALSAAKLGGFALLMFIAAALLFRRREV
ncbi:MAG TPA: ABC transporter permease [Gammaproteobacteria bacterium]